MIATITIEREHGHIHLSALTSETFDGCPVGIVQTGHSLVEALRALADDLERDPEIEERTVIHFCNVCGRKDPRCQCWND